MRASIASLLLTSGLLLGACQSAPPLPAGDPIGEDMNAAQVYSFAEVDAEPEAFFERTLLVEATATAVCASKGCWMQIEDAGSTAMVRWEDGCDGRFAFPQDVAGQRVLIQGSFYPKTISEEDAAHIEVEAGGDVEIEREGYEFNASAIIVIAEDAGCADCEDCAGCGE